MLQVDAAVSDDAVTSFVFRIEVSPEQVDALAPRLREALSANGNDGELTRRAATIAAREERLEREQLELEERARRLSEREAELGQSDELTASERIRLAQRRQSLELSEQDLETREHELFTREAEFEADVLLREDRIERWRAELSELEERLERRERDLAAYVDQLQDTMSAGAPLPGPPGVSQLRRSA
jgi:chromosome segregation ATPase